MMTLLTDKHWASLVPQDKTCQPEDMTFSNFYPHASKEVDEIIWIKCNGNSFTQKIPPGTYCFLFTTKTATEEDARKVVEHEELFINGNSQGVYYCNYFVPHDVCEWYKRSVESLHSLLRSKGLDENKNYAIIEKLK